MECCLWLPQVAVDSHSSVYQPSRVRGGPRRYAGDAISIASSLSVARLNFFLRRCTMPTGRASPGAFSFTATRRPCSISACMVRSV